MFFNRSMMGVALRAFAGFAMSAVLEMPAEITGIPRRKRGGMEKRNWTKKRSRYMPHQGDQECARRVRQMAAVAK